MSKLNLRGILFGLPLLCMLVHSQAIAGSKISVDENTWISIGLGARGSFATMEGSAPDGGRSSDFTLDGARLYFNGQINDFIKFEVNTECVFCGNSALREYTILDAIAKFELRPAFNIWAGRLLVPSDRAEMSGPFYANTYDFNKTAFYPSDFSVSYGTNGAGVYGRDHGAVLWGRILEDKFHYAVGVFNGLESATGNGPNQDDNMLFGGRFAYHFLSPEKNPGYYTSSTYYGGGGDILTVAYAVQYQEGGSGTVLNPGDFLGMSVDLLFERKLENDGVFTFEGEYKYFEADYNVSAFTDGGACFCIFDGKAWTATALYLIPQEIFAAGKLQPYVRYTINEPTNSSDRDEFEVGVNYIMDGHKARASVFYQTGDIATKGLNYAPGVTGQTVDTFKAGLQVQY